jgi:hypothetical protein
MRKLNQIRQAILFACIGLMFMFGTGGFSAGSQVRQPPWGAGNLNNVAGAEAGTQAPKPLTRTRVVYDYGLSVQQPVSSLRKIEGDWEGTLDAGVAKLRLVVHIVRKDGVLSATLDSPDQGARPK